MDCSHGNANAVNRSYNKVKSRKYLEDAWKYCMGIDHRFNYQFISSWCYSHVSNAVANHTTNIAKWEEPQQRKFLKFTTSMMKFIKNALTPYEIMVHYNAFVFVLSFTGVLVYLPTALADHKVDPVNREQMLEIMSGNIDKRKMMDLSSSLQRDKAEMKKDMMKARDVFKKREQIILVAKKEKETCEHCVVHGWRYEGYI
eukprot:355730_1